MVAPTVVRVILLPLKVAQHLQWLALPLWHPHQPVHTMLDPGHDRISAIGQPCLC